MCHCRALFSVTVSTGVANMGTTNYANRISNGNLPSSQRTIDPSFDTAAFAVPAQSTIDNAGSGILFGRPTSARRTGHSTTRRSARLLRRLIRAVSRWARSWYSDAIRKPAC